MIHILTVISLIISSPVYAISPPPDIDGILGDEPPPAQKPKPQQSATQTPPPPSSPVGPACARDGSVSGTTSAELMVKMFEQVTGIKMIEQVSPTARAVHKTLGNSADTLTLVMDNRGTAYARLTGSYNMDLEVKMCRAGNNTLVGYIFGGSYNFVFRPATLGKSVQMTNSYDGTTKTLTVR